MFKNMQYVVSVDKVFATFDTIEGLGWNDYAEDDYVRFLKENAIVMDDNGIVKCSDGWQFLLDRKERRTKWRIWMEEQNICKDIYAMLGDRVMSEQEIAVALHPKFSPEEVRSVLIWMDTMDMLTSQSGTYAIYDDEEDQENGDMMVPYSNIELQEDKYSIFEYLRKVLRSDIELTPDFQRSSVWTQKQKSRFIESAILGIPLPPIYLKRDARKGLLMVDGLQRTMCLRSFFKNDFELVDLKTLTDLNGCTFKQLKEQYPEMATRLEDKQMYIYILAISVRMQVVYDIFDRINTGGTQLTRQEIRNCVYSGASTKLLNELASSKFFKKSVDNGIKPKRMKDREAILRCLAFSLQGPDKYAGSIDEYMVKTMQMLNECTEEQLNEYKERAMQVFKDTTALFGKRNFRLPSGDTRGRVAIAVMETVFYNFWHHKQPFTSAEKQALANYMNVILGDETYKNAVRWSTSTKLQVDNRFGKSIEKFNELIAI